jgi:hypothetical protein
VSFSQQRDASSDPTASRHFDLRADQEDILELSPLVDIARKRRVRNFPQIAVGQRRSVERLSRLINLST